MKSSRVQIIQGAARQLVTELWEHREEFWPVPPSLKVGMLPIPLQLIATGLLSLDLREVDDIPGTIEGGRIAGVWDPVHQRVSIARGSRRAVQRFTLAHELGHAVLHPELVEPHRTRPLDNQARSDPGTSAPSEREADLFATDLLMPPDMVRDIFLHMYGGPISLSGVSEEVLFGLWARGRRGIDFRTFFTLTLRERALLIAENVSIKGTPIRSLADVFGVSPTAMARQLGDTGLVS